MKVTDILKKQRDASFSFEIIPPPRGRSIRDIVEIVEHLMPVNPQWIDVTSHASSAETQTAEDGTVHRRTFRKRPGTLGICGVIQNRFKVDTVAHMLCLGFTREETEDALIELNYMGVENILALRGDGPNYDKRHPSHRSTNEFASDLVQQVVDLRRGKFCDDLSNCDVLDFCIGVAGYPEKHFQADNLDTCVAHLKRKVDAGADYVVSQMFFDNRHFFAYVEKARTAGITVPIVPGLKVLKSAKQLRTLPKSFYLEMPTDLVGEVEASPEHAQEIGLNWARQQTIGLLEAGFRNVHFYVMNDAEPVAKMIRDLP